VLKTDYHKFTGMDQIETYKKVDTGKAWKQVHRRLQAEGLLSGEGESAVVTLQICLSRGTWRMPLQSYFLLLRAA
jgi:hypothetical protein